MYFEILINPMSIFLKISVILGSLRVELNDFDVDTFYPIQGVRENGFQIQLVTESFVAIPPTISEQPEGTTTPTRPVTTPAPPTTEPRTRTPRSKRSPSNVENKMEYVNAFHTCRSLHQKLFTVKSSMNLKEIFTTLNVQEAWLSFEIDSYGQQYIDSNGFNPITITEHQFIIANDISVEVDRRLLLLMNPKGEFRMEKREISHKASALCLNPLTYPNGKSDHLGLKRTVKQLKDFTKNVEVHFFKQKRELEAKMLSIKRLTLEDYAHVAQVGVVFTNQVGTLLTTELEHIKTELAGSTNLLSSISSPNDLVYFQTKILDNLLELERIARFVNKILDNPIVASDVSEFQSYKNMLDQKMGEEEVVQYVIYQDVRGLTVEVFLTSTVVTNVVSADNEEINNPNTTTSRRLWLNFNKYWQKQFTFISAADIGTMIASISALITSIISIISVKRSMLSSAPPVLNRAVRKPKIVNKIIVSDPSAILHDQCEGPPRQETRRPQPSLPRVRIVKRTLPTLAKGKRVRYEDDEFETDFSVIRGPSYMDLR